MAQPGGHGKAERSAGPALPHQAVDVTQLLDHGRGEDERVKVRMAHAAVEAVDRERERQPSLDDRLDPRNGVDVEVHFRREVAGPGRVRIDADAESARGLQGIDYMQI